MSGVTGLTLGKSKTERGTGDELERQKVPHNDKSQLSEGAMHLLRTPATPEPSVVPGRYHDSGMDSIPSTIPKSIDSITSTRHTALIVLYAHMF